jgi:hypothetical protein
MAQNERMLSVKEGRDLVAFFLGLNEDMAKVGSRDSGMSA